MVWSCRSQIPAALARRHFTVRVEAHLPGTAWQRVEHAFDLFLGALPEHEAATDARHRERERRAAVGKSCAARAAARPALWIRLSVLVRMRRARWPCGISPAKVSDCAALVHAEDRADQRRAVVSVAADGQREQERRRRQARGALAEIALVQRKRRLAVELVEDVALRARDPAFRPEARPAGVTARAYPQALAVQPTAVTQRSTGSRSPRTQVEPKRSPSPARPPVTTTFSGSDSLRPAASRLPLT